MKDKINNKSINEVLLVSKKILNLLYIMMLIGILFLITILIKELKVFKFLIGILKILTPFFIGFIIAWIFNPIVIKLENKGLKRNIASIIIYLLFIFSLFIFFYLLIPIIYNQLNDLINSFPSILSQLEDLCNNITSNFKIINLDNIKQSFFENMNNITNNISNNLPDIILNSVGAIISCIGTIALSLIIGLFMLIDFKNIRKYLLLLIPNKYRNDSIKLVNNMCVELRKYVHSTLFVAFLVFIFDFIGFACIRLDEPILLALLCGITDLIPYIGPYIGGLVAVIVGFSQSSFIGFATLIIVIIVQIVENSILQPIVMSKSMKIHPVMIMIGLLIFGHFFGILGMVIATPMVALIKVIINFIQEKYHLFKC